MRKIVMDVKAVVGTAPKTSDPEYNERAKDLRAIERALEEYLFSVEKMKSAAKTMSQALDSVTKAFEALTADVESPAATRDLAVRCRDAMKKVRDEDLATYVRSLEGEVAAPVKHVKEKITDLKRVEVARNRAMAEYDTYRDAVAKKETEYEKKGKDISQSKNYREDVAHRDAAKTTFDQENSKYKEQASVIHTARFSTFLSAMKSISAHTATYFASVDKNIADLDFVARKMTL